MKEQDFKIRTEIIRETFNDTRKIKCITPEKDRKLDDHVHPGGDIFTTEEGEFIDLEFQLDDLLEYPPADLPYSVDYWDPIDVDIFHWRAIFIGPEGTPYENGAFEAEIKFDTNYPKSPPSIKFKTRSRGMKM